MLNNTVARGTRWLIADHTSGRLDVFTLDGGGDRVLPVFSFEDEAGLYVHLQPGLWGWQPRGFSPGEIVSVLYGPLSDVARVALDPLPDVCEETALDLLCVRRRAFVVSLVGEGRGGASAGTSGHHPADVPLRRSRPNASRAAARATNGPPSLWPEEQP